ncbi:LPXTG cell wall anchor domain-containing protein [Vagococcus carniphilus]|uniref:LPXTG cell wall anchor domain-containing protein n=1 Tax=Vagococcus carniphilus TaxID=218144 RepID=UPI003B5C8EFD
MRRISVIMTFFIFTIFLLFGVGNTAYADNLEGKDMVETTGQVGFYGEYVKPEPSKPDGSKPIEIKESKSSQISGGKQLPQTNEVIRDIQSSLVGIMIIFLSLFYVKKIKKNG